ncbi:hypothetical protein CCP3SC1AL1_1070005 [Gammaproteobacteria bacterium]
MASPTLRLNDITQYKHVVKQLGSAGGQEATVVQSKHDRQIQKDQYDPGG